MVSDTLHLCAKYLHGMALCSVSGLSDAFLCVVSRSGQFRLYSFKHMQGLKLEAEAELEGLRVMIPFSFNGELHLLASTDQLTTLLNVVTSGPG